MDSKRSPSAAKELGSTPSIKVVSSVPNPQLPITTDPLDHICGSSFLTHQQVPSSSSSWLKFVSGLLFGENPPCFTRGTWLILWDRGARVRTETESVVMVLVDGRFLLSVRWPPVSCRYSAQCCRPRCIFWHGNCSERQQTVANLAEFWALCIADGENRLSKDKDEVTQLFRSTVPQQEMVKLGLQISQRTVP